MATAAQKLAAARGQPSIPTAAEIAERLIDSTKVKEANLRGWLGCTLTPDEFDRITGIEYRMVVYNELGRQLKDEQGLSLHTSTSRGNGDFASEYTNIHVRWPRFVPPLAAANDRVWATEPLNFVVDVAAVPVPAPPPNRVPVPAPNPPPNRVPIPVPPLNYRDIDASLAEIPMCTMCEEHRVDTMVLPCMHAVCCHNCSDALAKDVGSLNATTCIICRTEIVQILVES